MASTLVTLVILLPLGLKLSRASIRSSIAYAKLVSTRCCTLKFQNMLTQSIESQATSRVPFGWFRRFKIRRHWAPFLLFFLNSSCCLIEFTMTTGAKDCRLGVVVIIVTWVPSICTSAIGHFMLLYWHNFLSC